MPSKKKCSGGTVPEGTKASRAKYLVYVGEYSQTRGGLTKKDLMKNKHGKVVSKKQHATGKRLFKKFGLPEGWKCNIKKSKKRCSSKKKKRSSSKKCSSKPALPPCPKGSHRNRQTRRCRKA